jgi:hypothetical protein
MDCEHSTPGLAACTMSCCKEIERALIAPVLFLLDGCNEPRIPALIERLPDIRESKDLLQSFDPLSPPPRLPAAA